MRKMKNKKELRRVARRMTVFNPCTSWKSPPPSLGEGKLTTHTKLANMYSANYSGANKQWLHMGRQTQYTKVSFHRHINHVCLFLQNPQEHLA